MLDLELLQADLIRHEGLKLKPYRCSAGKLTLGVGRNLEDVGINREEALYLLENDIRRVVAELDERFPWFAAQPDEVQRVLANMAFNLGIDGFAQFKRFHKALVNHEWETAAAEMLDSKWAAQVGGRAAELAKIVEKTVPA